MDWVKSFEELVVKRALRNFESRTVSREQFEDYFKRNTMRAEWDEGLFDNCYRRYIFKIGQTADRLGTQ